MNDDKYRQLYHYLTKKIDFSEFLETEIGCTLRWSQPGAMAGCICPFPDHKEKKGSFRITLMENGSWIYHCFGCGRAGNVIQFCQKYYSLSGKEAISFLCKKFGFEDVKDSDLLSAKEVDKKFNVQKRIECAHIEVANQCRRLLRKDYNKYNKWVSLAYRKLNKALDEKDLSTIEKMGFEACNKIGEN